MKTTLKILVAVSFMVLVAAAFKMLPRKGGEVSTVRTLLIERGELTVLSQFEGAVESENALMLASSLGQRATIVEMAEEGALVEPGDVLVRFDATQVGQTLIQLEKELVIAQANLAELQEATLPLELDELDARIAEVNNELAREQKYQEDVQELYDETLLSLKDVEQQRLKVEQVAAKRDGIIRRVRLMKEHVHPAALAKGQAVLNSAMKDMEFALSQEEVCVIRAPRRGMVIYKPMHIEGEFRTARPGDGMSRNQVFLILADPTAMIARCYVPEGKLGGILRGAPARITPLAMPGAPFEGAVQHVGSMAHRISGKPTWQKYVQVEVGFSEQDARLRSGMSVFVQILSHHINDAVLVPRAALDWVDGYAYVDVLTGEAGAAQRTQLKLGAGNASHFEVLHGLEAGERIRLP